MTVRVTCRVLLLATMLTSVPAESAVAEQPAPELIERNRATFYEKLANLQWVAYNPTTFAPGKKVPAADIEADLKALIKHGFKPGQTGLCTYSASPESGHDVIPRLARDLGFSGCILGIWTINNKGENDAARELAKQGLIDAICCGNEGYQSRYSWDELRGVIRQMRVDTRLPVSTSEQWEDYGDPNLTDPKEADWLYPNIHPIFRNHTDVEKAADFVHAAVGKLAKRSSLPILVHETGWVSKGLSHHTPELQREFWAAVQVRKPKYPICLFEAFDQPWKNEVYRDVNIGGSWGLFTSDRQPKPLVEAVTAHRDLESQTDRK